MLPRSPFPHSSRAAAPTQSAMYTVLIGLQYNGRLVVERDSSSMRLGSGTARAGSAPDILRACQHTLGRCHDGRAAGDAAAPQRRRESAAFTAFGVWKLRYTNTYSCDPVRPHDTRPPSPPLPACMVDE